MDRIIFGDNQFFGVNHMSEEKAQAQLERFSNDQRIIEVLDVAYDAGLRAFMFSTHDRVRDICGHFRAHRSAYGGLRFYPVLPYAQKYAALVAEKGLLGLMRDSVLDNNSAKGIAKAVLHGGVGVLTQDPFEVMKVLIDAEMKMFRGLELGVVFLQNIVADLLLGLGLGEGFLRFSEYIRKHYGAAAGFMTMNLPAMVRLLKANGLENPIVCTSINKIGYLMNPSRDAYETTLSEGGFRPVAMSVLASGAIPPREAIQYVCSFPAIQSIIFGASSRVNIVATKGLIEQYSTAPEPMSA